MENYNAKFIRDVTAQVVAVQRPNNAEFHADKWGKCEHAMNKLFTDLVTGSINITEPIECIAG